VKFLELPGVVLSSLTFHPRVHLYEDFDEVTMKEKLSPYRLEKGH
jgi:hypothetical protein